MTTLSRRRSGGTAEDERPARTRRSSDDMPTEERNTSERPARSRRSSGGDEDKPTRTRRTGGMASYAQKRKSTSTFADEFKPEPNTPTLFKILDSEFFDVFNQHWIDEGNAAGKTRHSFVCRDDEFFDDNKGCPLCDIGDNPSTYSLLNVLDLTNPRKPEVKVWKCSVTVSDQLVRMSQAERTSPLDREDLYFELTVVKTARKTSYTIESIKARDLQEDFGMDPLDADELSSYEKDLFEDRTAITQVDSYDDLAELADSIN